MQMAQFFTAPFSTMSDTDNPVLTFYKPFHKTDIAYSADAA
jgi:hypothetical protein